MIKNNYILLVFLLIYSAISYSQKCAIVISSTDTTLQFKVTLNKENQTENYLSNVKLTGLNVNYKYEVKVQLKDDTTQLKTILFLLDEGFTHYYSVDKKGIYLKKISPTINDDSSIPQTTIDCEKYPPPLPAPVFDSTEIAFVDSIALKNHYKLKDYDGKIGCPWPMKEDEFNAFFIELKQVNLDEARLTFIKEQLDTACLLTTQIRKLFETLEYEDLKLRLGLFVYPKTFDVDRFFDIAKQHLKFESHIEEIREKYKVEKKD